jgi:hypothetical protein
VADASFELPNNIEALQKLALEQHTKLEENAK